MTLLLTSLILAGLPIHAQDASPGASGALCGAALELPSLPGARWPSLAAGADGRLYATWIEATGEPGAGDAGNRFVLAVARLEGQRWLRLADAAAGRDWFVNWADMPALAALEDGTLAASFLEQSGESAYAYAVHVVLSRDGGASWSEPLRLHADARAAEHGFVSLEPLGERFAAVWLDGRATPEGPMALLARTVERDGTLGAELCLDERVCDCCQTAAVAVGPALAVAYRDRTAEELRDIAWLALEPGSWAAGPPPEPRALAPDGWKIAGCPVNGPALAARAGELAAAWFTLGTDGRPRVLVRRLGLAGAELGGETVVISEAEPLGRVDLAFDGQGALWVSWLERRGEQAEWMAARLPGGGSDGLEVTVLARVASIGRDSGFARLACSGGALYFAWTDPGTAGVASAVRTLRLDAGAAEHDPLEGLAGAWICRGPRDIIGRGRDQIAVIRRAPTGWEMVVALVHYPSVNEEDLPLRLERHAPEPLACDDGRLVVVDPSYGRPLASRWTFALRGGRLCWPAWIERDERTFEYEGGFERLRLEFERDPRQAPGGGVDGAGLARWTESRLEYQAAGEGDPSAPGSKAWVVRIDEIRPAEGGGELREELARLIWSDDGQPWLQRRGGGSSVDDRVFERLAPEEWERLQALEPFDPEQDR